MAVGSVTFAPTFTFPTSSQAAGGGIGPNAAPAGGASLRTLTAQQQLEVAQLRTIDAAVKAHELAHEAVGGPYAGPPSYQTVTGPDGQAYAVGGEVQIDTAPIPGNPKATIAKLEQVIAAALAPVNPSAQDRTVAVEAGSAIGQARTEVAPPNSQAGAQGPGQPDTNGSQNPATVARLVAAYQRAAGTATTTGTPAAISVVA